MGGTHPLPFERKVTVIDAEQKQQHLRPFYLVKVLSAGVEEIGKENRKAESWASSHRGQKKNSLWSLAAGPGRLLFIGVSPSSGGGAAMSATRANVSAQLEPKA